MNTKIIFNYLAVSCRSSDARPVAVQSSLFNSHNPLFTASYIGLSFYSSPFAASNHFYPSFNSRNQSLNEREEEKLDNLEVKNKEEDFNITISF